MKSAKLPVELIVATTLHMVAQRFAAHASLHKRARKEVPNYDDILAEAIARDLLRNIAHGAHLPVILAALAAAGGPDAPPEILARYHAVAEQQRGTTRSQP